MKHLEIKKKKNISSHYFSDEIYGKILDSVAIACSDVILICDNEILLTKRNIEPRAEHWAIIGGRMTAGESPVESTKRKLLQESGLDIEDKRFKYLNTYSAYYLIRHQEPQKNGSHTINITHIVEIAVNEKEKINLVESEYDSYRWINVDQVMNFLENEKEDIYIKTIIGDLIKYLRK